jgi:D-glycero-D-manno-heptose 1,7-bisphosphate phosphatase
MLRAAAFLDRDGTIIEEREYLADPEGVALLAGAAQALRSLQNAGYALVVVTNQSGIARGYYREEEYQRVQARLEELLAREGVALDGSYYCPHHPDFTGRCDCRKPGTALYRRAARELGLHLAGSIYVGDRLSDVLPALELGGRGFLVATGYGAGEAAQAPSRVTVVPDLAGVAAITAEGIGRG